MRSARRGQPGQLRIKHLTGRYFQVEEGKQHRQGVRVTLLLEQTPAKLVERLLVGRYRRTQLNHRLVGLFRFKVVAFAKQEFSPSEQGIGREPRVGVRFPRQQLLDG